jgi:multidrug efflux system outer membrane protein
MAEPCRCSRRWRTLALLAALSVALAACQTTPTAPPTLDLPPATATAAPDLERWWTSFDDPTLSDPDRRSAGPQPRSAGGDGARRPGALERAARAVPVSTQASTSAPTPAATAARWSVRSRCRRTSTRPTTTTAPACGRPTKSTSGDVTGTARMRRAASCWPTEYARQTVRTAVAAETARAYFGLLAADAELAAAARHA